MYSHLVRSFPNEWEIERLTTNLAAICECSMAFIIAFDSAEQCYASVHGAVLKELGITFPALSEVLIGAQLQQIDGGGDESGAFTKALFGKTPAISFIAGLALLSSAGKKFGMLCVLDAEQRTLSPSQTLAVETIAGTLVKQLELEKPFVQIAETGPVNGKLIRSNASFDESYDTLKESESKYRTIFRNSTVGFFIASLDGLCEDVNSAFCELVGRERHELLGQNIGLTLFEHDKSVMAYLQAEVIAGRSRNLVSDVHIRRPDRQTKWGRASVAAIYNSAGQPIQTMNLIQDFTLQKKAKLERDQVFEQSVDMFAIIEYDGTIFQTNPACTRNFGVAGKELLGRRITDFVHPEDLAAVVAVLQGMKLEKENLPALDVRMKFKDGQYHNIRWSGTHHTDQARLIVIGRDVTHSVTSKRALQRLASRLQQIREEERTRISREIHDELGQILTALKIDLDLFKRDIDDKPAEQLKQGIESITQLVASTLISVKRIAQDLRPEVLDALGLVPALEWQAKETQARTGLDCEIICKQTIPSLDSEQTTQLFRIIQEALTNVVRHANASIVRVIIEVDENQCLQIKVTDNGKGFVVGDLAFRSLGLLGMQERARNIAAQLTIHSQLNKGTTVSLSLATMESYWEESDD